MILTRELMGTVVSIDVRDPDVDAEGAAESAFHRIAEIEDVFSTYRADSEISRLGRGELTVEECSAEVAVVLQLCEVVRERSNGAFDIYAAAARPPASELQVGPTATPLEPSGMVKGWAIDEAVTVLRNEGLRNFSLNAGGDVFAAGWYDTEREPWRIGLQHPLDRSSLMAVVQGADFAVATSGTYERGEHIVGNGDAALLSITIVGPDITMADAFATAAFAMGRAGIEWAAALPGFDVFAVDGDGMTFRSPGLERYLVS